MTLTFDNLTEDEQLQYANQLETWARNFRDAYRWKQARRQELADAGPPPGNAEHQTLERHIDRGFARRTSSPPTIDSIRSDNP